MTGRNAYCMSGIKTKVYDKFILPAEAYKDKLPVCFDVKDIHALNQDCLDKLQLEITCF